jgi:polyisoprenoid-binding protein YceI
MLMRFVTLTVAAAAALALGTTPQAAGTAPLALSSARVSLQGTSNIHAYTATSKAVRIDAVDVDAVTGANVLDRALEPNAIRAFEVVIPATSLSSPADGIDKNMHKALKASEHPDIRFRLQSLDVAAGVAVGQLTIAGVEKDVTLSIQVKRQDAALAVTGTTTLLMTDYGIAPPKAMLGMLKTNPKVTITFDLVLSPALAS